MSADLDTLLDQFAEVVAEKITAKLNGNVNGNGHQPEVPDQLLTVEQAAKRLGVTARWIYGHASTLPFVVKLPNSRAVRFSERGITKWLAKRMG